MRTSIALCLALFLTACGGSDKPAASTTPETGETGEEAAEETGGETPAMMTAEECEAGGGTVAWDPGDGSGQCDAGFFESGHVSGGDEGGLCCQPMPDNAE